MATAVNSTLSTHALYFDELDHFQTWLATNQLAQSAQLLFYKLLDLFHRSRWPQSIRLSTVRLMALLDCSKSAAYRARQKLAEAGFISFHRGKKGAPASYQFCSSLCHSDCNADSHDNPHSDPHIGPHSDTYGGPYRGTDGGLNPDIHPGILGTKTDAQQPYITVEKQEEIKENEHFSSTLETECPSPKPVASPSASPYDEPYSEPYPDTYPGTHPDGQSPLSPPPTPSPRSPSFPPLLSPQTPFSSPPYYPPTPLPEPPSLSPFFPAQRPSKIQPASPEPGTAAQKKARERIQLWNFDDDLNKALLSWVDFRASQHKALPEPSLQKLCENAQNYASQFGTDAVTKLINACIEGNYSRITWEQLDRFPQNWTGKAKGKSQSKAQKAGLDPAWDYISALDSI